MKRVIAPLLVLAALLPLHAVAEPSPTLMEAISRNWLCAKLPNSNGELLCTARDRDTHHWFHLAPYGEFHLLQNTPDYGGTIVTLLPSPDGALLAVAAGEEGHPLFTVYALPPLLQEKTSPELFSRGVYPGSAGLECWHEGRLIVGSDQDLEQGWHLGDYPENHYRFYAVDIKTGKTAHLSGSPCPPE